MANIKQTVDLTQGTLSNLIVEDGKLKLPNVNAPTFTRGSIAYKSDGSQVAANQPRFDVIDGVLGLMVEEGTTNLFTNPRLLNNGSGWSPNSATAWVNSSGEYPYIHCEQQWDGVYQTLSLYATTYTLTYLVKHKAGSNTIGSHFDGPSKIRVDRGAWVDGNIITVPSDGNWHLVEIQATYYTAASGRKVYLQPGRGVTEVSEFYFKYAQIEQKPYATSFIDGTRAAETLTIPTAGVLSASEGTIEVIYIPNFDSSKVALGSAGQDWWWIFGAGSATNTNELRLAYNNGSWHVRVGGSSDTTYATSFAAGDKISLALAWKQGVNARLFINGVKVATFTPSNFNIGTIASIGYSYLWNQYRCNGLIDDLRISNRARTDAEILAAYQSGQPLPVDEWTTYLLRFSGALNFGRGGYYISPQYDLSTVGSYVKHRVYWQEDADKEECLVYAKLDNQSDWTQLTNGGSLPIVEGQDLTGRKIQFKAKLLDLV